MLFGTPGLEVSAIGVWWFTNLDSEKQREPIVLTERYSPEKNPRYDNYDAVNVDRTNHF